MYEAGQAVLESSSDGGLNPWGGRGMINPGGCQLRKGSINTTGHLEAQLCVAEVGEETHISVDGVCTPGCTHSGILAWRIPCSNISCDIFSFLSRATKRKKKKVKELY